MPLSALPAINATLNATSAILLTIGYVFIRRKRVKQHKVCMLSAVGTSTLFLASYLFYHYHAGSTPFTGQGVIRHLYFAILISHSLLAAVIVPLVLITLYRAFTEKFDHHARLARWTLPLWLYVSVTGVLIYLMLYQL